eukprot:gene15778-biopygen6705
MGADPATTARLPPSRPIALPPPPQSSQFGYLVSMGRRLYKVREESVGSVKGLCNPRRSARSQQAPVIAQPQVRRGARRHFGPRRRHRPRHPVPLSEGGDVLVRHRPLRRGLRLRADE